MKFSGVVHVWKITHPPYLNKIGRTELRMLTVKSRGPVIYYDNSYGFDVYQITVAVPKDLDCPYVSGMLLYMDGEIRTYCPNKDYNQQKEIWAAMLCVDHKNVKIIAQHPLPNNPADHIKETGTNSKGIEQ